MNDVFKVDPDAIYDDAALALGLGVTQSTLARARRTGELRSTRKGRRVLYRGEWIIAWLEGNATQRQQKGATDER